MLSCEDSAIRACAVFPGCVHPGYFSWRAISPMNPFSVSPEASPVAAWVGLDWADQQHVICLYEVSTGQNAVSRLEQKPEALQDWLSQLRQRFGGAPVVIVLEQARGAVIYALLSADFVR